MLSPRWRKVVRDLWGNKLRTVLVVLSIAVGVFAVGTIAGTRVTGMAALDASWNSTRPAGIAFDTDFFDEELLYTVRHIPGVQDADGLRETLVRFQSAVTIDASGASVASIHAPDESKWRNMLLNAYPDFESIRVGKVFPQSGAWPPPYRQVLIERASLGWVGAQVGDTLLVKSWNGRLRELRIAGTVHDPAQMQAFWNGMAIGYVDRDTMEWLGVSRDFDDLRVIASPAYASRDRLLSLAQEIRAKVEKSGRPVYYTYIPTPGKHPAAETVEPVLMILGVLGLLALVLGGLLVVNTMQAVLTQQVRQMGIMKAIGASNGQVMGIYGAMVIAFGLLALLLAVPLGALGAYGLTQYLANLLNFNMAGITIPPGVLAMQVAIGLAVPVLAALYPLLAAVRVSPHTAMSDQGLAPARPRGTQGGPGVLARLPLARPALLALRNTFRRRGRLALTLATLILGGATFIGVLSVRDSLRLTLDNAFRYVDYDAILNFRDGQRLGRVVSEALSVPGVTAAEGWRFDNGRRVRPDGTESSPVQVRGVPAASALIRPSVAEGRWLLPEDENAIVVNTMFLKDEPDVTVGSRLRLNLYGRETDWEVVGIANGTPPQPLLHVNYPYLARVLVAVDRVGVVIVATRQHDPAAQAATAEALEAHFKSLGMEVSYRETSTKERAQIMGQFNVLIVFLLLMAVLLAAVGAIGLMGTMSLNVLERTREIGLMRAIGASDGSVFGIVVSEGLTIGLISWGAGAIVGLPLGKLLGDAVGAITLRTALDYTYSLAGLGLWLAIAAVLAVLASLLPARRASRVSVRDVLAYE